MCEKKTGDEISDEIGAYSVTDGFIAQEKAWFMTVFSMVGGVPNFVWKKHNAFNEAYCPTRTMGCDTSWGPITG